MTYTAYHKECSGALMHGELKKPSRSMPGRKLARLFVVKDRDLVCYKDANDQIPHTVYSLRSAAVELNKGVLLVKLPTRILKLLPPNSEEGARWLEALETATLGKSKPQPANEANNNNNEAKAEPKAERGASNNSNNDAKPKRGVQIADPPPSKSAQTHLGKRPDFKRAYSRTAHRIEDIYQVKEELGSGGFSTVKRGIHKEDKSEWALKMIRTSVFQKNRERTDEEIQLMAALDHPGIVKLREVVRTHKFVVIVMEILRGGELFDRIVSREKYDENDAKDVAIKMLESVRYLHENSICHRDLKPENLIFDREGDDAVLKLTDFGFATLYNPANKLTATCGTPEYVAPEILDEKPYDISVDMWSCGVIIYILLCGFPPFFADSEPELFDKICTCKYSFISPYWDHVSDDAKDLIRHLLELDPNRRYTAEQALAHRWLKTTSKVGATDLSGAIVELKRYNATRKFRKGVLAVLAANKIKIILASLENSAPPF